MQPFANLRCTQYFIIGFLKEASTLLKDLKLTKEYFYGIDLHDSMGKNNPKSTFQNQSTEKKNNFEGKTFGLVVSVVAGSQKFMFSHSLLHSDSFSSHL